MQNDYHNTALMKACERGHADTVRVLLDHGASVNQQNKVRNNIPIVTDTGIRNAFFFFFLGGGDVWVGLFLAVSACNTEKLGMGPGNEAMYNYVAHPSSTMKGRIEGIWVTWIARLPIVLFSGHPNPCTGKEGKNLYSIAQESSYWLQLHFNNLSD